MKEVMSLAGFVEYFFILVAIMKGVNALQVSMSENITGETGYAQKTLLCSYSGDENVDLLKIIMKINEKKSDSSLAIVWFYPPTSTKKPTFTPDGQYLEKRVKLENPTHQHKTAVLIFHEFRCEDEAKYICEIRYDLSDSKPTTANDSIKLISIRKPTKPYSLHASVSLRKVESGQTVSFLCYGNLGKPDTGKLIWRKQKDGKVLDSYHNVTSEEISENCTIYGESNLTLQITETDHGAVVECTEESLANDSSMWIQTQKINVNYKVRRIFITKNPDSKRYIAGSILQINLTCLAEGNPMPTYHWYKDSYDDIFLGTGSMLGLQDPSVNMSGAYICKASQHFGDVNYNATKFVNLSIVPLDPNSTLNQGSHMKFDIVTFVIVSSTVTVVIAVIIVIYACYKRRRL